MVVQGVGNLFFGVLGVMLIIVVIVCSLVNVSNGVQSKLLIFIYGVLLLICGLWFSGLLILILFVSFVVVLFYIGYKLVILWLFIEQFCQGVVQYVLFFVIIGGIIVCGMLVGIGIGFVIQMVFSFWCSYCYLLQLVCYDDYYVLCIQQNLIFMYNLYLLVLLVKILEKSVVIVEYDSVGYFDLDVWVVLDDFVENVLQCGICFNQWLLVSC